MESPPPQGVGGYPIDIHETSETYLAISHWDVQPFFYGVLHSAYHPSPAGASEELWENNALSSRMLWRAQGSRVLKVDN